MSTNALANHPEPGLPRTISADARRLMESLSDHTPDPVLHPALVVVSGLPGTGKSFFSQRLAVRLPLLVLESDALRKAMVDSPLHTPDENARLFRAVHELIDHLLGKCIPVLLDATSLVESHREQLYHVASRHGAKVMLVLVEAPEAVVRQRLEERKGLAQRLDHSDADWEVYQRLRPSQEPIRRKHLAVDTSGDIEPALAKVARDIRRWIRLGR